MLVLVAEAAHVSCFVPHPAVVSSVSALVRSPAAAVANEQIRTNKFFLNPRSHSPHHSARTGVLALKAASMQGNKKTLLGHCVAFVRSSMANLVILVAFVLSINVNALNANAMPAAHKEAAVVSQVQVADSSLVQNEIVKTNPGMAALTLISTLGLGYVFFIQKAKMDQKSMRPRGPKKA